ncbi:MAG: HNH endonuclease [Chloroflexi bacterium]|nr:HNH endonuclease [Chloroflexota bacterium]
MRERARGCCEYCRLASDSAPVRFHVDHIIPVKHGGTDAMDNLCLACFSCNAYIRHDLAGFDPDRGQVARLSDPRASQWTDHFRLELDMRILGLTPHGRATVRVLQFNLQERIESRQELALTGEYPC